MSFNPEDYTYEDKLESWYEQWPGRIVGHVSLLRDLLDTSWADGSDIGEGPAERLVHRMTFDMGYWIDDSVSGEKIFITGHNHAEAVVLGLDESDPEDPTVTLGDYQEYHGPDDSQPVELEAGGIVVKRLREIGFIMAGSAQPERWQIGLGAGEGGDIEG